MAVLSTQHPPQECKYSFALQGLVWQVESFFTYTETFASFHIRAFTDFVFLAVTETSVKPITPPPNVVSWASPELSQEKEPSTTSWSTLSHQTPVRP